MKIFLRVVTALTTAALVALAILNVPVRIIAPVMIVLAAAVHLEFSQMVAKKYAILTRLGVFAGVAFMFYKVYYDIELDVLMPLFFLLALRVVFSRTSKPVEELATTAVGILYIPVMLSYFIRIPMMHGPMMLLYVIAMVKFSDMGGFAVGLTTAKFLKGGNHKMCPTISPNKSWEGLVGSVVAGLLMSVAFLPLTHMTLPYALMLGLIAAIVGTLGDLIESRIKREIGVKDSATFMPAGLGGFLDMFDSLIFAPALIYQFL